MGNKHKPLVLLIEDELMLSQMYRTAFELKNIGIIVAGDVDSGWELTLKNKPSIVLLDLLLPQNSETGFGAHMSTGFNYLRKIKKATETKDIPVIMLTNLDTIEDRKKSMQLGAIDYIVKSNSTPKEIVKKVEKILQLDVSNNQH